MFSIDFTFLWTLVNLLLLFFFLKKVLFTRVGAFMKKRAARLAEEHEAAARERTEASALLERYNEKLRQAAAEGDALIKQARKTAEGEAAQIIAAARTESARITAEARRQIQSERQTALFAFKAQAATLALAIAGRVLRRKITSDDDLALAERALQEIAALDGH